MTVLLALSSCHTKDVITPQGYYSKFEDYHFLDSIFQNNIAFRWENGGRSYDSVFRSYDSIYKMQNLSRDTFNSKVMRIDTIEKRGFTYFSVVLQSKPEKWNCKVCEPLIETFIFRKSGNQSQHFVKRIPMDFYSMYGQPPEIGLYKIGNKKFGYKIQSGFEIFGDSMGFTYLYELNDSLDLTKILEIDEAAQSNFGSSARGSGEYYSYGMVFSIDSSKSNGYYSDYYNLKTVTKGTWPDGDKISPVDTTISYLFTGNKYQVIQR